MNSSRSTCRCRSRFLRARHLNKKAKYSHKDIIWSLLSLFFVLIVFNRWWRLNRYLMVEKRKKCRTNDDSLHYVLNRLMLHYHFQTLVAHSFFSWIIRNVSTESFYCWWWGAAATARAEIRRRKKAKKGEKERKRPLELTHPRIDTRIACNINRERGKNKYMTPHPSNKEKNRKD